MRYVIFINGDEKDRFDLCKDQGELVQAYQKYTDDLRRAGVLLGGEALYPSERGARVAVSNGKRVVTDGPFTEAKEVIGGYFVIQAASRDEALEWAARCPGARASSRGFVEVREILDM